MIRFAQFVFAWMILSSLCNAQEIVNVRGQLFRKVCHGTHCTLERIADVIAPNRQVIPPEPMIPDPVPEIVVDGSSSHSPAISEPFAIHPSAIVEPLNEAYGLCDPEPVANRRPIRKVIQSRPLAKLFGWLFR